jgi:hypothetical protein
MNSFWINLYDRAKDRRYGAVFFGSLAGLFGVALVGFILYQAICAFDLQGYLPPAAAVAVLLLVMWILRGIRQMRARHQEYLRFPPLSRDERLKARSKLQSGMNSLKRPAPRAPDTNLKY